MSGILFGVFDAVAMSKVAIGLFKTFKDILKIYDLPHNFRGKIIFNELEADFENDKYVYQFQVDSNQYPKILEIGGLIKNDLTKKVKSKFGGEIKFNVEDKYYSYTIFINRETQSYG